MTIDLAAIEEWKDAATKGPWAWHGWPAGDPLKKTFSQKDSGHKIFTAEMSNADATFVVYARADIPALIAEVKQLEKTNEHWQKQVCIVAEERERERSSGDNKRSPAR